MTHSRGGRHVADTTQGQVFYSYRMDNHSEEENEKTDM